MSRRKVYWDSLFPTVGLILGLVGWRLGGKIRRGGR